MNVRKLVQVDTSFFRAKKNQLEKICPSETHTLCISESVDLELNDRHNVSEVECNRRINLFGDMLEKILILLPRGRILTQEIDAYMGSANIFALCASFPLCEKSMKEDRIKFILENDPEAISKLNKRVETQRQCEHEHWEAIPVINDIANITENDLREMIKDVARNTSIYVSEYDVSRLYSVDQVKFRKECPACFNLITNVAFLRLLRKQVNAKNNFTMCLDGKNIQFKKSFITDIIMAASFLPYVDFFYTCDQEQARMLKFIFNDYKNKIQYYSQQGPSSL